MSFKDTMARLNKATATTDIIQQTKTSGYTPDPNFWQPKLDAEGKATALIRFLPAPEGEEKDFVNYFTHYIVGPNKRKYIERCRSSLGSNEADPAQELASKKTGDEKADKEWYSKYGRKVRFAANILILQETLNPENNGKVFKWDFGMSVMGKIQTAMKGTEDPIDPKPSINVIHPINGANFKVVIKQKGENNNYDDSYFMPPVALFEGNVDKFVKEVWEKEFPLQPVVAPELVKSYAELRKLLVSVIGEDFLSANTTGGKAEKSEKSSKAATTASASQSATPEAPAKEEESPESIFESLSPEGALSTDAAVDSLFES